ncbi:MAG: histidinol dehydrogenase, partial [Campylobacteraceae bacterium]|nr:histidinol dehydrogenase [Campylobacteraceae bacterium]
MKILYTKEKNFKSEFETLLSRGAMDLKEADKIVEGLLDEIKHDKNSAVKRHILKFDKWEAKSDDELEIPLSLMKKSYDELDASLKNALHEAYNRIFAFHEKQLPKSWLTYEDNGIVLG